MENFQTENKSDDNGPSIKIQMYEFFFSNILIKAMQVPFLEHTFMLSFFENTIRKRINLDEGKNKSKRKAIKRKEHEEMRRERTLKLRQFYEFFSLLFDQKLFTPFAQFLCDKSLAELQYILKNRIKKREVDDRKDSSIEDLKMAGRSQSKIDNIRTPLGYAKDLDNKLYIKTVDHLQETMKEQESSVEDDYRETSRFGDKKNNFNTIYNHSPSKSHMKHKSPKQYTFKEEMKKKEFSNFTDRKFSKIVDNPIQDNTLTLSNIAKENNHENSIKINLKGKKLKKYEIYERINQAQLSNIGASQISKIENINNSGMSQSYDLFTNMNMTPIPINNKLDNTNNRYLLRQDISKSDLSASFLVNQNKESLMRSSEINYKSGMTPQPVFPQSIYPAIDPTIKPYFDSVKHKRGVQKRKQSSKSNSEFSQNHSSISRIFQPSPDKFSKINNDL